MAKLLNFDDFDNVNESEAFNAYATAYDPEKGVPLANRTYAYEQAAGGRYENAASLANSKDYAKRRAYELQRVYDQLEASNVSNFGAGQDRQPLRFPAQDSLAAKWRAENSNAAVSDRSAAWQQAPVYSQAGTEQAGGQNYVAQDFGQHLNKSYYPEQVQTRELVGTRGSVLRNSMAAAAKQEDQQLLPSNANCAACENEAAYDNFAYRPAAQSMPQLNPTYYQQNNNIQYHEHNYYAASNSHFEADETDNYLPQVAQKRSKSKPAKGVTLKLVLSLLLIGVIAVAIYAVTFKKPSGGRTYSLFNNNGAENEATAAAGNETPAQAAQAVQAEQTTAQATELSNAEATPATAAGPVQNAAASVVDSRFAQGGISDLRGIINLSNEQLGRMIDINKQPDTENVYHNLDVLAEVDVRAKEVKEREAELSPGEIRLAAKNEAFDFVYKEFVLPKDDDKRDKDVAAEQGASSLGKYHLPGGKYLPLPYYKQWDERWGYKPYGGSIIGTYGCGVTAMASVLSYMTSDAAITPDKLALLSAEIGTDNEGTDIGFMSLAAEKYQVNAYGVPLNAAALRQEIDNGHPVIINVTQGDFTSGGHYIVVVGYDERGNFLIYDPVSPKNTAKTWSIDVLQRQNAQAVWSYSK